MGIVYGKRQVRAYTDRKILFAAAKERDKLHIGHSSRHVLAEDHDVVGVFTEDYVGAWIGYDTDLSSKAGGDKGIDFDTWEVGTIDVKGLRNPHSLLVPYKEVLSYPLARIFILVGCDRYSRPSNKCRMLGWAWDEDVLNAPHYEYPRDIPNWIIPREHLRYMSVFWRMFNEAHGVVVGKSMQLSF